MACNGGLWFFFLFIFLYFRGRFQRGKENFSFFFFWMKQYICWSSKTDCSGAERRSCPTILKSIEFQLNVDGWLLEEAREIFSERIYLSFPHTKQMEMNRFARHVNEFWSSIFVRVNFTWNYMHVRHAAICIHIIVLIVWIELIYRRFWHKFSLNTAATHLR